MAALLPAFLAHAARHGLLPRGARVIAAVSGGADSTCLLHLLLAARARLDLRVEAAHVDHGLRGRASARDAAAVAAAARALGVPFHLGRGRPFTPAERRRSSVQELARQLRLGYLLGLARRRRAIVALGHTADDQAETVLMRVLGGAGPPGLAGIPPASHEGRLVHPLLFARRAAIEDWLTGRGVGWRTDRTNLSRRYLRNRVRLDLLPLLRREYNPRLVERLGDLARALRRDEQALCAAAGEALARAAEAPGRYRFAPGLLRDAEPAVLARAVLAALRALAGRPADFSSRHLEALLGPGTGARAWDLPAGVRARRDGAGLVLEAPGQPPRAAPFPPRALPVPGAAELAGAGTVTARTARRGAGFDPRSFGAAGRRVALDLEGVRLPLEVRARRAGDRFQPLGLHAAKKLKEFLIDAGVPAAQRARLPLVCDREGIVWVAGVRPAERCRVGPGTRHLLVLEHEPAAAQPAAGPGARLGRRHQAGRGPATMVSSSSSASSAASSGRVRLRAPSREGSAEAPPGPTSTSSTRTGRRRSSSSSGASAERSDSAAGGFTATRPSAPSRRHR